MSDVQMTNDGRRSHPSSQRNREPIRQVLADYLKPGATVLEIAAGTGEQAVYLSKKLDARWWFPTDVNPAALESIDVWAHHEGSQVMQAAQLLDVTLPPQKILTALKVSGANLPLFDAILCINMIHISPWAATEGLMRLAAAALAPGGILYLYGPYKRNGIHSAQSNADFDLNLKSRDAQWGIRDLTEVSALAHSCGLESAGVVEMPVNNLSVLFRKPSGNTERD
jgi:SAM-dependent methyltransferase